MFPKIPAIRHACPVITETYQQVKGVYNIQKVELVEMHFSSPYHTAYMSPPFGIRLNVST
jgi:ribulose 1,5-bisphosphate carboxylase large subunit-like protein